ncbi:hypothetical protein L204_106225 [Cryptococcus depauperatus]
MAKRGSKSTKLQKGTASKQTGSQETNEVKAPSTEWKVSDALKEAVIELGGDEEDLELIEGVDEDDETSITEQGKFRDEKLLKKELGEFMKGLDFEGKEPLAAESSEGASESNDEDGEEESDTSDVQDDVGNEHEEEALPIKKPISQSFKDVQIAEKLSSSDPDPFSAFNVPASTSWPSLIPSLPPIDGLQRLQGHKLNELRQRAVNLLNNLPPLKRASSSSDQAFITQILHSGTHQDKLSALVLIVRESPVHAVKELDRLRNMVGWKEDGISGGGKDQRVAVMKALSDWWVAGGGKEHGKLKYFVDQPLLTHPHLTDRHLLMFAFEDYLKKWFFSILQVLEVLSHDTLPFVRTQAIHIMFRLLAGNAEQEQNLLRLGVNKLGDIDRPVASKASHHILQLLQSHPAMKAVVAREISGLVLKPSSHTIPASSSATHVKFDNDEDKKKVNSSNKANATSHGRYYGLITLNQITLTRKDQDVAGKLVDLYFEIFREILGDPNGHEETTKENKDEINGEDVQKTTGKVDKWRGRHKGTKHRGGRKSALEEEELVETTVAKLVAAILTGINRALPFAKLDDTKFSSYTDTLFKIIHSGTFNTSIQALQLLFKVSTTENESRQIIADRFYKALYGSLFDGRLITSSKQAMYLNLLFKAMRVDDKIQRVMTFVKRLLQMLSQHQPPFICGALYLLGELFNTIPGLKRMLIEPEDDGEEHFVDADAKTKAVKPNIAAEPSYSKTYDGRKRDPTYANAESSCLWELTPFLYHFHPSVSLQANQLLNSQPLTGSSDISLNTLISFLDRFVYRNPKKTAQPKGASIMQPAAASDKSGMIIKGEGKAGMMVNSEAFWRKKIEDVPVDIQFFHSYFTEKLKRKEKKGKAKEQSHKTSDFEESDNENVDEDTVVGDEEELQSENEQPKEVEEEASEEDSDPEEAEIWKAMKASMPHVNDNMDISEDDFISISNGSHEDSDEESDEDEEQEGDEEEGEDKDIVFKGKNKKRTARSTSPASSASFPNFDDEDDDIVALSDINMPDIVLDGNSSDAKGEVSGKRKKAGDERKERKKKRKELPMFGSYEDYAALIEQGDSED